MNNIIDQSYESYAKELSRDFFKNVYAYMFAALAISGILAYMTGTLEFAFNYFIDHQTGDLKPLYWVCILAPFGLGLVIQLAYNRLSMGLLMLLFIAYSALMGLSLGQLFLVYTSQSIYLTFFISAGAFAAMAILGYTTKTDLTKMGSLLYMGFIGIFIAGVVNMFMHSETMGYIMSILGVIVFTGLTAYFMQNLKKIGESTDISHMDRNKLALVGGLQLYILFVNLFVSLLRLFGDRN